MVNFARIIAGRCMLYGKQRNLPKAKRPFHSLSYTSSFLRSPNNITRVLWASAPWAVKRRRSVRLRYAQYWLMQEPGSTENINSTAQFIYFLFLFVLSTAPLAEKSWHLSTREKQRGHSDKLWKRKETRKKNCVPCLLYTAPSRYLVLSSSFISIPKKSMPLAGLLEKQFGQSNMKEKSAQYPGA